jgi:hypothetical protein
MKIGVLKGGGVMRVDWAYVGQVTASLDAAQQAVIQRLVSEGFLAMHGLSAADATVVRGLMASEVVRWVYPQDDAVMAAAFADTVVFTLLGFLVADRLRSQGGG